MIESYADALNFIHGRTKFKKIPTLDRMRLFLKRLGNPQDGLKYVHVTGTNGKGSTVAMLRKMLIDSGLNVGSFTSPFITRFNERIELNAEQISDADLTRITQKIEPVVHQLDQELATGGPTEFEIDTAIMFCYFAEKKPDLVILEVGIGGRYDSTNVILPLVSVITTVGWDHMKYLGNTLAKIADQKAGIIKEGVPTVIGQLPDSARDVILKTAMEKHSSIYELGKEFSARKVNQHAVNAEIEYNGGKLHQFHASLSLAGDYQVGNAAIAITTAQLTLTKLGIPINVADLKKGLMTTSWPGRMELVIDEPPVLLDGAHNLPGMQALVKTLRDDFSDREIYILVAILADKQYDLMLGELASLGNVHLMVTNFSGPGPKRPSANLADVISELKTKYPVQIAENWQSGFVKLSQELGSDDVMLVTGSLYFISEIRKILK
ncbi:MAG: bifunctional folylpolyglutamate synthase/dihydrofolate synthase [Limosilactobacillus sp.]|jgi:dihydrofolate synthase/folylpolyglutamate synthase|uniref:bifunctional folylpolyglutamate synthase/dihydrofolate synthase n=1 Tax=Limosilactobacillus sp. TaxID=2773925 RepID=UPI0025BF3B19|nr:folylpolyglutamate synthase/dihydrofolate synthase family protein [Limosilactobacillus sp.]MCI1974801.1 bifunctional folylpolyglutamate synthase/dihydrofolate synthase [Limosilactobacillus sp.]MCI2030845.1 bifunctional folylpolyglutamate synthase/dihydrofolate synthase [Limosilactobacillus sp.]